jgi:hypothetical protein
MGIPTTGPVSLRQLAKLYGGSPPYSLSNYYRNGQFVAATSTNTNIPSSGRIAVNDFYGAATRVAVTVTVPFSTAAYDVYANRGGSYVPGATDLTVVVGPNINLYATANSGVAMSVPSSFLSTDTVTIVNNGNIRGAGGRGGAGGIGNSQGPQPGSRGNGGGTALLVDRKVSIINNGTIAGGGGGGGGGGASYYSGKEDDAKGGAGGGGGAGTIPGAGGAGGPAFGQELNQPGTAGSSGTRTAGGTTGVPGGGSGGNRAGFGGTGGTPGAAGGSGASGNSTNNQPGGAGGAGGRYIAGNINVTWVADGTRLGRAD